MQPPEQSRDGASATHPGTGRGRTFRSLAHANFRRYYLGQLISLHGTWMQRVAQAWLMYRLTDSSVMLGLAGAATLAPNLVFALFGGVLADVFSRRHLMIFTQVLAMGQAVLMALLTLTGQISPWHILVLALVLGTIQAFETPARHSLVAELVPRDDLHNAVALNSTSFHLARFVGPAVAGVLVAWVGEGPVFAINAVTFLAALAALITLRLPPRPADGERGGRRLTHGLRYAWHHPTIRGGLAMVAVSSLVGASAVVLMPVFAREVFGGGAEHLGWLMGAMGLGAMLGALSLARRGGSEGLERVVAAAGIAAGLALMVFAMTASLALALPVLTVAGFSVTTLMASTNAFIQFNVPDALRGRVMALFTLCLHGAMPLGHVAVGGAGEWLGAPATVLGCGVILLGAAGVFHLALRRVSSQSA